jgi:hypothetical protein
MNLSDALDHLIITASSPPRPFDTLPDELLSTIFHLVLPPSSPPATQARRELNSATELQRNSDFRHIAVVDKRFRRIALDRGDLVVRLGKRVEGGRMWDDAVHSLTLIVSYGEELRPSLPNWMLTDLRVLTVAFVRPMLFGQPPSLGCFAHTTLPPTLTELNVFGEKGGCIPGGWVTRCAVSFLPSSSRSRGVPLRLLGLVPHLKTLRLSHPDETIRLPLSLQLESLQIATIGIQDCYVLSSLLGPSSSLHHLHLVPPFPPCQHDADRGGSLRYLASLLRALDVKLKSFTLHLDEEEEPEPAHHLLYSLLQHTPLLERLDTSRYNIIDPILSHLPSLLHLRYFRLIHLGEAPASEQNPSHWSWTALAENVVSLLQSPDRIDNGLRIEVKCEGTLRKYAVAQKSCISAFRAATVAGKAEKLEGIRIFLEYWQDRPMYQAWPFM